MNKKILFCCMLLLASCYSQLIIPQLPYFFTGNAVVCMGSAYSNSVECPDDAITIPFWADYKNGIMSFPVGSSVGIENNNADPIDTTQEIWDYGTNVAYEISFDSNYVASSCRKINTLVDELRYPLVSISSVPSTEKFVVGNNTALLWNVYTSRSQFRQTYMNCVLMDIDTFVPLAFLDCDGSSACQYYILEYSSWNQPQPQVPSICKNV